MADNPSLVAEQRLTAISHTQDGFALAEEDLRLRGPGEFFGTRQSGLPDLKVAHYGDLGTLRESRTVAEELFRRDPLFEGSDCRLLRERVTRFLNQGVEIN
jgi:ATP-dependent DNA helicase RecG